MFLSAKAVIAKLDEKALLVICGCNSSLTLNDARVARFLQRVATSTQYVYLEKLHPTSDTTALSIKFKHGMVETYMQENRVGILLV